MLNAPGLRTGSAAAGREGSAPTTIRPVDRQDLPAVARLFEATFRSRDAAGTASLASYLGEVLFEHPWRDPDLNSLVYVDGAGQVGGFIAVFPLRLMVNGAPVRGALAGTLMVERPAENPFAGARLMRSFLNGPQDISLSESANETSQRMWEKLGGETATLYSMEWLRVFPPGGFRASPSANAGPPATRLLRPLARGFDALAGAGARQSPPACAGSFARRRGRRRRIDRSHAALRVHLRDAAGLGAHQPHRLSHPRGDQGAAWHPLPARRSRLRRGAARSSISTTGGRAASASSSQILARPGAREAVIDDLLADAMGRGLVALRGRVQPEFAGILLRRRAVFLHAASTLMHSRHQELLAPDPHRRRADHRTCR